MASRSQTFRSNVKLARSTWGKLTMGALQGLRELTERYYLSIAAGDIQRLEGRWYITHTGLLHLAHRNRCFGIRVHLVRELSDPSSSRWVFKATAYKSNASKGFVGYGDADPSNVSSLVHGAEMRVAETRAVNRALRKAYGIGLCSVEELGWTPRAQGPSSPDTRRCLANGNNGHENGQPRLRDRLCLLIREYNLDAALVKAYAADFCKTSSLRDAGREQVEAFINKLAESAANDRDALVCQLNSYARQQEANP